MVHPYHGIPLCNKKEQILDKHNSGGSQGNYVKWKMSISNDITFSKWLSYRNEKLGIGQPGVRNGAGGKWCDYKGKAQGRPFVLMY